MDQSDDEAVLRWARAYLPRIVAQADTAPSGKTCHECKRSLAVGESAWADDWKVIDTSGERATTRTEIRYTCDDCAPAEESA